MRRTLSLTASLAVILAGCSTETPVNSPPPGPTAVASAAAGKADAGFVRKNVPEEDPGPPIYARLTPILDQFFHTDGWLAIPVYRDLACVPADFNLLDYYHPPGPGGPGAFGCPLQVNGFLLIEPDAPLGTFPKQAVLTGDAVPFLFVSWDDFQTEAADGVVTLADLRSLGALEGTADRFHETLKPRVGEHQVVIQAAGTLEDGRRFQFGVTHLEDETVSIRLRFR